MYAVIPRHEQTSVPLPPPFVLRQGQGRVEEVPRGEGEGEVQQGLDGRLQRRRQEGQDGPQPPRPVLLHQLPRRQRGSSLKNFRTIH